MFALILWQPRSQGISSLPPLVLETETLVAAGHVTAQNLGVEKSGHVTSRNQGLCFKD